MFAIITRVVVFKERPIVRACGVIVLVSRPLKEGLLRLHIFVKEHMITLKWLYTISHHS